MVKKKIDAILSLLEKHYPDETGLKNAKSAFQLLVAAVLSAQSTDKQVNRITPILFKKFPNSKKLAEAPLGEIERIISSVGLYKNKARNIKALSKRLVEEYNSEVPDSLQELEKLPGVGRKTANVVLNDWFGKREGIAVDTHVKRISFRLGLSTNTEPKKIEEDLKNIIPRDRWGAVTHYLISHGRAICKAKNPKCKECFLKDYCGKNGVEEEQNK